MGVWNSDPNQTKNKKENPDILQEAKMIGKDNSECNFQNQLTDNMLCVYGKDGAYACVGDSGGLLCHR
jgi:hypothetical protein